MTKKSSCFDEKNNKKKNKKQKTKKQIIMNDVLFHVFFVSVAELIGYVVIAAVAHQAKKFEAKRSAREDQLMQQLLGRQWESREIEWFATHTICRQCNRFFDTTDAEDRCDTTTDGFHTYTPALHLGISRAVARAYRRPAPPIFLPGAKPSRSNVVRPPRPLESEWVLLDETDDNDAKDDVDDGDDAVDRSNLKRQAVADMEITPGVAPPDHVLPPPDAHPEEDNAVYNSSDLHELAIMPSGAIAVPDEVARASYKRLVSSLSPSDLLSLELPHPPEGEPQDDDALDARMPHPPSEDPMSVHLPSYIYASASSGGGGAAAAGGAVRAAE
jgi:hypothetical protein